MKRGHLRWLWLLVIPLVVAPVATVVHNARSVRSVQPLFGSDEPAGSARFIPAQSAALFVGVRKFDSDSSIDDVPYAVDDAIDLAYAFTFQPNVQLVLPAHIVLALSGTAQKKASREKLKELRDAGAVVTHAGHSDIIGNLEKQAASVGSDGLLVISFATHGFNSEGVPFVLASSSLRDHTETAISTSKVLDVASSNAGRSLVLLDACRERLRAGERGQAPDPMSAAPLLKAMGKVRGQVVLYAAAAGRYAYDNDDRQNGVFTAAVLDGLLCDGSRARRLVTAASLAAYVEASVRAWVRANRDRAIGSATQMSSDGGAEKMPLALCLPPPPPTPPPPTRPDPMSVEWSESSVTAYDQFGTSLWSQPVNGHILRAQAVDLDGDERNEIVVAVDRGTDAGKLMVFDGGGKPAWAVAGGTATNYPAHQSHAMTISSFVCGDLFRKKHNEIVAVFIDDDDRRVSRIAVFDYAGRMLTEYWHDGPVQNVFIDARTAHHKPRIIASAINNDLHHILDVTGSVASVFMLDPGDEPSESPPYAGKLGSGNQDWYGSVGPPGQTIATLRIVDDHRGRAIAVKTSGNRIFYLDFDGKVRSAGGRGDTHFTLVAAK
jgi:hypothetical protein